MNINIDVQFLCTKQEYVRGIPYYIKNLVETLAESNSNKYAISFFDYKKERKNREYIERYIYPKQLKKLEIVECNTHSYKEFFLSYMGNNTHLADKDTFEDYIGGTFDVIHFPSAFSIPQNVKSCTVVTAHDVIPCIDRFKNHWDKDSQQVFFKSMEYIKENERIVVIADSKSTKTDLKDIIGISDERIKVVPLAIDKKNVFYETNEKVLNNLGITGDYLLYLGALDPRKGIINIIEAFSYVKSRYTDIKLVLAGGFEKLFENDLINALHNSEYEKDIVLTGYVTTEQKRILLSSARVFLFPSEYEGFGLPVLEAMTCKTPVITTYVSSLPEVGGDAALYVEPNRPTELAETIEKLMQDSQLYNEQRELSYEQSKKFSWEKTAKLTEEVYQFAKKRG